MIAFTFPGQGSQKPGMGEAWKDHPSWELVEEASGVAGRDVAQLLLEADADELRDTRNAQLATYVLSLVVLDAVERLGVDPARVAGHSLGEYTALTAAATCMASPRSVTSFTPSAKDRTPAAVRAVYSPRLCPATRAGSTPRRSTASSTTRLRT